MRWLTVLTPTLIVWLDLAQRTTAFLPLSPMPSSSSLSPMSFPWVQQGQLVEKVARQNSLSAPLRPQMLRQYSRNSSNKDDEEEGSNNSDSDDKDDEDADKDDDETNPKENPYADPNYPQLEFVNYDDPEYSSDRGASDEFFAKAATQEDGEPSTEEQIEAMREDRRRRNDEYQFQTYYTTVLREGEEFNGEWTVYKTDTFLSDLAPPPSPAPSNKNTKTTANATPNNFPRLVKATKTIQVVTTSYKKIVPFAEGQSRPVEAERIIHVERIASAKEDPRQAWKDDVDTDSGFREKQRAMVTPSADDQENKDSKAVAEAAAQTEKEILSKTYWPSSLRSLDFRGPQGIMVVGNAYTISTALDLQGRELPSGQTDGPFSEYRAELGLSVKDMRLRIKLDYARLTKDKSSQPPLHLRSLTVCREGRNFWPRREGKFKSLAERTAADGLFGATGADGGLYDPPPVGSDQQATQYMVLDLEGHATVLFPYLLDQEEKSDQQGWVSSLDWAPGTMRYQVDRKVGAGKQLLGLRTLELSEVQTADAEQYRPKDGGQNMRQ